MKNHRACRSASLWGPFYTIARPARLWAGPPVAGVSAVLPALEFLPCDMEEIVCGSYRRSMVRFSRLSILSLTRYRIPATVDTITDISSQVWTHLGSYLRIEDAPWFNSNASIFLLSLKKIRLLSAEMFERFRSFFSCIEVTFAIVTQPIAHQLFNGLRYSSVWESISTKISPILSIKYFRKYSYWYANKKKQRCISLYIGESQDRESMSKEVHVQGVSEVAHFLQICWQIRWLELIF